MELRKCAELHAPSLKHVQQDGTIRFTLARAFFAAFRAKKRIHRSAHKYEVDRQTICAI
jgi:hypothetical protein